MKLNVGDIFTIPLRLDEVGFGQIVAFPDKFTLLIVMFDYKRRIESAYNIEEITSGGILFLGYTLDALLHHKHWVIIGNRPVTNVELPYHKLGTPPDSIFIIDYTEKKVRKCTIEEFNMLDYKTIIAPIRYENALKAYYGLQDWIVEDYDKLLYARTLISGRILFGKQ